MGNADHLLHPDATAHTSCSQSFLPEINRDNIQFTHEIADKGI